MATEAIARPIAVEARERLTIDKLFFGMLFLIPFIPRPTLDHPSKYLAPVVIAALAYIYALWFLARKDKSNTPHDKTAVLGTVLMTVMSIYLARVVVNGEWDELPHLGGRLLGSVLVVITLGWMNKRNIPLKDVYRAIFNGSVGLSLIVIFVGVTGIAVFGEIKHARTLGIAIPFHKSVGIPRSYGEFGVIMSVAWAYMLIYGGEYKAKLRVFLGVVLFMAILISQSRSTWVGIIMVTAGYMLLKSRATKRIVASLLLVALVIPVAIEMVPKDLPVVKSLVGESTYKTNVSKRYDQYRRAVDLLTNKPSVLLLGIKHSMWMEYSSGVEGEEESLHSHFFSILIFLGLIGGTINLLVYLLPMLNLISINTYANRDISMLVISVLGVLTCLHFYEGFFSMITSVVTASMWHSYRMLSDGAGGETADAG